MPIRNCPSPGERVNDLGWVARCHYCDRGLWKFQVTRDHIVPKYHGGPDSRENYVESCERCNRLKAHFRTLCECDRCRTAWDLFGPGVFVGVMVAVPVQEDPWVPGTNPMNVEHASESTNVRVRLSALLETRLHEVRTGHVVETSDLVEEILDELKREKN